MAGLGGPLGFAYIHGFCCCFPATSLFLAAFKDCWAGPGCELIKNKGAALRLHTAHLTTANLPEGCRQLLSLKLMGTCITALTQLGVVGVTASCCCKVIHVVTASHVGQRAGSDAPSCANCGLINTCTRLIQHRRFKMRKAQNFLKGLKGGLSLHHGGLLHGTYLTGPPRSGERNTWLTLTATEGAPLLWLPVGHCQWHQEWRHSPGRVHEMACRMSMGWQPRIACPRGLAKYPVTLTLE